MQKTYIETFNWDIFELNIWFEDFLKYEKLQKSKWETDLILKDYQTAIKFTDIRKKGSKRILFNLPASWELIEENKMLWPWKKELTQEERNKINETIKKGLEKTFEKRRKKFLEQRKIILDQLAKDELRFWLETTLEKLEKFNKLKLEIWKTIILIKENK